MGTPPKSRSRKPMLIHDETPQSNSTQLMSNPRRTERSVQTYIRPLTGKLTDLPNPDEIRTGDLKHPYGRQIIDGKIYCYPNKSGE